MKMLTDKKVEFDSVWVAGKKLKIKVESGRQNPQLKSTENAVITLLASDYVGGPDKIDSKEEEKVYASPADSAKAPVKYKGAALLRYVVAGSTRYFAVSNITVLPPIYQQ